MNFKAGDFIQRLDTQVFGQIVSIGSNAALIRIIHADLKTINHRAQQRYKPGESIFVAIKGLDKFRLMSEEDKVELL